jgi:hypothetical protein
MKVLGALLVPGALVGKHWYRERWGGVYIVVVDLDDSILFLLFKLVTIKY